VHWVYEQAFTYFRMGPAAAAVVLVLIPLAALPWALGRDGGQGR
jgi:ABC-type sugar transport system permease subunit